MYVHHIVFIGLRYRTSRNCSEGRTSILKVETQKKNKYLPSPQFELKNCFAAEEVVYNNSLL